MDPEIEVRAGGQPRGSHVTYHLSLPDSFSFLNSTREPAEMHVSSGIGGVMSDLHVVSSTSSLVGTFDHHAVSNRLHGRARGSRVVHAMMGTVTFQNRMKTSVRETGRDTNKIERCLQELLPQAIPALVEILSHRVLLKRDGTILFSSMCENGPFDIGYIHHAGIVDIGHVVHHPERVPLLHVKEIDLPSVHVRELEREQCRGTGPDDRIPHR